MYIYLLNLYIFCLYAFSPKCPDSIIANVGMCSFESEIQEHWFNSSVCKLDDENNFKYIQLNCKVI